MSPTEQIVLTTVGVGMVLVLAVATVVWLLDRLTGLRDRVPGHTRHTAQAARRRHQAPLPRTRRNASGAPYSPGTALSRTPTPALYPVHTREAR